MKTNFRISRTALAVLALLCAGAVSCDDDKTDRKVGVTEVTLDKPVLALTVGQTQRLAATVVPDNATDKGVTWHSDRPDVASVDETGLVAALAAGETTVTVTTVDGHRTAACKVTVTPAAIPVAEVRLDRSTLELTVGESGRLAARVLPEDADDKTVVWHSDKPAVATVGEDGLVRAVAAGEATVTASAGGESAACAVTVHAKPKVTTVYATGYYDRLIYAYCWQSGQQALTFLGDDAQSTRSNSIFVAGGDVYIGGQATTDEQGYFAPTLWKNGEATFLTDAAAPIDGEVQCVTVDGNDIYASGYYRVNRTETTKFRKDVATLWKNGTQIELTDGTNYAQARSVCVCDGTVYLVGEHTDEQGTAVATLWTNRSDDWTAPTVRNLSDGSNHAYAQSVCVAGGDLYVAGYGYAPGGKNYTAMLWKNDEPVQYLSQAQSWAYSVCAANGHVYVAGWEYAVYDGRDCAVATLWIDGIAQPLTTERKSSQARCVFVSGEDIYVAGFLGDVAVVWKNGEPTALSDGTNTAAITSVFVTEQ